MRMLRKATSWAGLAALLATSFIAAPASASTQMGARSATPTTLRANVNANYTVTVQPGTTGTVGAIKVEICDSPLETVSCAASASADTNSEGADMTTATFGSLTGTGWTGGTWVTGTSTGPGTSGTSMVFRNTGTGIAPTTAQPGVWTINTVGNPDGNNQKYYLRVTTYSDNGATPTVNVDFGAMALQTAQDLTVSASVQEALTFCVGATVGANCATVGAGTISLATGSGCPIMGTANACTGTSQMAASTNANTGYAITYTGTVFTGPSDTITAIGASETSSSPGTKQFGLAVTTLAGSGSATLDPDYDFGSTGYAYVTGSPQAIAAAGAATAENTFTVTYIGNVNPTTQPGQYTSTINYVCTGLF